MQRSYPGMRGANRIVFDSETPDYEELIIVSGNSTNNGPYPNEGEQKLIFRGTVTVNDTDVTVNLTSGALYFLETMLGYVVKLRIKPIWLGPNNYSLVTTGQVFSPEVSPAGGSEESDSGDEDVPVDQAIPRVFNVSDIGVVQLMSDELWKNFTHAKESSFSNGPGKWCLYFLGQFLGCTMGDARYESSLSTNAGGSGPVGEKDMQAGSCILTSTEEHFFWSNRISVKSEEDLRCIHLRPWK